MPNAFAVRHVAFEDLGVLERLLAERGFTPRYFEAGVDDLSACQPASGDLLVVLGGPIGAYEEDRYPFLIDEMRLLEQMLKRNVPILGICLGAQLLARVLGARVYPGSAKEIGYGPIELTVAGQNSPLRHLEKCDYNVLHWHGDTFDLPAGASRLASTHVTLNQAFALGRELLALQFHVEADPRALERWLIGHTCELTAAEVDVRALRQSCKEHGARIAAAGVLCLGDWLAGLAKPISVTA